MTRLGTISAATRLVVAPGVTVRWDGPRTMVACRGLTVEIGPHGLAVLDAFRSPSTLGDALSALATRVGTVAAAAPLLRDIGELVDAEILVDETLRDVRWNAHGRHYDGPGIHVVMIDDHRRTEAYRTAIRRQVRPGDLVVDIGSGTGLLAAFAAQAGARHVHACERTPIAEVARALLASNGLADQVTVVECDSSRLELSTRADVLTSELLGDEGFDEGLIAATIDARQRLLKPGGVLIPRRVCMDVLPLAVPRAEREAARVTPARLRRWQADYGLDFSALLEVDAATMRRVRRHPLTVAKWPRLADPARVAEVDLHTVAGPTIEGEATVEVTRRGPLSGLFLYFVADLGADVMLSQHPDDVTSTGHWPQALFLLPTPRSVRPGDRLRVTYRYDPSGSSLTLADA